MPKNGQLTEREIAQQDMVDDACYQLITEFCPNGIEDIDWNIELIGKIRDALQEVIVDDLKLMTEQEFYPYIEEEDDGNIILEPVIPEPEELIITDEQIVTALVDCIKDMDADALAELAKDWFGGLCWYSDNGLYVFIPDERYMGAFDWTKEINK